MDDYTEDAALLCGYLWLWSIGLTCWLGALELEAFGGLSW